MPSAAGFPHTPPVVLLRLVKHSLAMARLHRIVCPEPPPPIAIPACPRRCDESLCNLRLAAAITEIQRLKSSFSWTNSTHNLGPAPTEFRTIEFPDDRSGAPTARSRRKLYAPPALGELILRPRPESTEMSAHTTITASQRVASSGRLIDLLV